MSKLNDNLPENYFDFIEMKGDEYRKRKKPLELIDEQHNYIFNQIKNLNK